MFPGYFGLRRARDVNDFKTLLQSFVAVLLENVIEEKKCLVVEPQETLEHTELDLFSIAV